ncbi:MAG TPA: hypothetical protein VJL88_10355, partial [Nitrospira sp.]|nr:hypothetical protein [Nitrospira sp.]
QFLSLKAISCDFATSRIDLSAMVASSLESHLLPHSGCAQRLIKTRFILGVSNFLTSCLPEIRQALTADSGPRTCNSLTIFLQCAPYLWWENGARRQIVQAALEDTRAARPECDVCMNHSHFYAAANALPDIRPRHRSADHRT